MTDKEYFLQAETEFESENYDDAVLAKANHFSRGNKDNLKHKYIELRVEDLTESAARMKKDKIISQATEYGKIGWGVAWKIGLVGAVLFLMFLIVYVFPNF